MFFNRFLCLALWCVVLSFSPQNAQAKTVSFAFDNDSFFGTDRDYSSGLFLRWSSFSGPLPYSLEIASQLWSPSDIRHFKPMPNERPYAGLLALKARTYRQNPTSTYIGNLMLGTVGPNSKAKYGQTFIHTLIGSPEPNGWEYQIYNEFVYQAGLDAHRLLFRGTKNEVSFFGRGQGGNFQSEVGAGMTYRFGTDLESTFGSTSAQLGNGVDVSLLSSSLQGAFFYLTTEFRYRFDDIMIEGEKPIENDELEIEHHQYSLSAGGAWYQQDWGLALSMTFHSKAFETSKKEHHTFGNLTLFYRY